MSGIFSKLCERIVSATVVVGEKKLKIAICIVAGGQPDALQQTIDIALFVEHRNRDSDQLTLSLMVRIVHAKPSLSSGIGDAQSNALMKIDPRLPSGNVSGQG